MRVEISRGRRGGGRGRGGGRDMDRRDGGRDFAGRDRDRGAYGNGGGHNDRRGGYSPRRSPPRRSPPRRRYSRSVSETITASKRITKPFLMHPDFLLPITLFCHSHILSLLGPAHARLDTEVATDVQEVPIETSTLCDPRTPAASLDNSLQASKAFTCTCIDIFPILMLRLVVNDVSFHESHASVFVQGEASKRCTYYSEFQMILSYSSHISRCF